MIHQTISTTEAKITFNQVSPQDANYSRQSKREAASQHSTLTGPLQPGDEATYRMFVSRGISAAAGTLSNPVFVQFTTQVSMGPVSKHVQFPGHGVQLLPAPSPWGLESPASRQQMARSILENTPNLRNPAPCFRLDRVWPLL